MIESRNYLGQFMAQQDKKKRNKKLIKIALIASSVLVGAIIIFKLRKN